MTIEFSTNIYVALTECAKRLLNGDTDEDMQAALEALLSATSATSVFIEMNVDDPELGLCSSMTWESGTDVSAAETWSLVPWTDQPAAFDRLSNGEPWIFSPTELDESEMELYEDPEQYSEADYPIFIDGEWRGSVGFGYRRKPLAAEYQALGAVAEMVAAYLKRGEDRERLERSVRDRTALVSAVSHELRTPLTGVVGLAAELAERDDLSDEDRDAMVRLIGDQAADMSSIVEDLLVAARSDASITIEAEPTELDVLATNVVHQFGSAAIPVTGGPIVVDADPARVRQILRNLVGNARKYGGENVEIIIGELGGMGTISVVDDGDGVDRVYAEAIFAPYERAHSLEAHPGSIGIGLTVSRRLARLMGGNIEYLRDGDCTVFRVALPAAATQLTA